MYKKTNLDLLGPNSLEDHIEMNFKAHKGIVEGTKRLIDLLYPPGSEAFVKLRSDQVNLTPVTMEGTKFSLFGYVAVRLKKNGRVRHVHYRQLSKGE